MSEKKTEKKESKTTNIVLLDFKEEKVDKTKILKERPLGEIILDMELSEDIRIEALEMFYKEKGDETSELVNKLASMYQFSGTYLLRSFLYKVCTEADIHVLLKSVLVKSLCSFDEEDEIGYKALNILYPSIGNDIGTPCKVELAILLMNSPKYKKNALTYFCGIINNQDLEVDYRYKTILGLEHHLDKKTSLYFIKNACWEFINTKNRTRYRILASQCLLQKCKVTKREKTKIQELLYSFASDNSLDHNLRADSADVLLQLGDDKHKKLGEEIILLLGREGKLTRTIYDNAQNVHVEEIDKSALEIIEFLFTMPTLALKSRDDLKEEKETGKTVSGSEIDFNYVQSKIKKLIEAEKKEKKIEKKEKYEREELIKTSLDRINMDRGLYSKYKCSLRTILIKVWSYIHGHKSEKEMRARLLEELCETAGWCSSGYVKRLANTITGFGDFSLRISWKDQIIANLGGRLNARAKKIDDLEYQELVLEEMMIKSVDYKSRKHFLGFFRKNLLSIREEMYQEFKHYISDTDFDLYFRSAIESYEGYGEKIKV